MTAPTSIQLYELMPTIYRRRDAEIGFPLQALMAVLQQQFELLQENIDALYE